MVKVITAETTAANLLITGGLNFGSVDGTDTGRVDADSALQQTNAGGRNRANTGVGDQDLQRAVLRAVQRPGKTACPYWDEMRKIYQVTSSHVGPLTSTASVDAEARGPGAPTCPRRALVRLGRARTGGRFAVDFVDLAEIALPLTTG